jgi:hypothetical protein
MSGAPESRLAIIGGGPAGLMAAEAAASAGIGVDVYDAMPSLARKFLLAGKSGLNLTHAEAFDAFASRYGAQRERLEPQRAWVSTPSSAVPGECFRWP